MRKLLAMAFLLTILSGCAVISPYGADFYLPIPTLTIDTYPAYYYHRPNYYSYGYYRGHCGGW